MTIVQAPLELEDKLRSALAQVPTKKRNTNRAKIWATSAVAAMLLVVGSYQYPAFAYYGGKIFNKTELNTLSFTEVAEQGYGQTVNKSKRLDDGTIITINGVIADDTGLLMFYTIDRPTGSIFNENESFRYNVSKLEGFMTDTEMKEGSGNHSKDETHFQGVYKFGEVSPFAKNLTVTFTEWLDNGELASYPISFKFQANKAMKNLLKEDISKSVSVDEGIVHYDSITASPTSTIVKGHYEMANGEYPRFQADTKLLVNGTEVNTWSMRSNHFNGKGFPEFEIEFDVLPTDKLETIELVLNNFVGYQKVDAPISLATPSDLSIVIGNEKLWIRSVTKTDAGYDIVIARKQFTILEPEKLLVQAGGIQVPVSSVTTPEPWDLKNGNILWEQTFSVETKDEPEYLMLDGFHYYKKYDQTISIPLGKKQ